MTRTALGLACVSALLMVSLSAAALPAVTAEQPPLTMSFWLSSREVIVDEPLTLHYRVYNHTHTRVRADFPHRDIFELVAADPAAWLNLECIGPDGLPAPAVTFTDIPKPLFRSGFRLDHSLHDTVVLTRFFQFRAPGSYTLKVNPRFSWAAEDGSSKGSFECSEVLRFEVRPADTQRLARIMDSLVSRSFSRAAEPYRATEELFSIAASQALPVWEVFVERALVERNWTIARIAIAEMVRAGTPEKADLLAEVLWGRYRALLDVEPDEAARRPRGEPAPSDSRPMILGEARTGLRNMYWAGETALKEHLRRLFVDNEGAMPDVKGLGYPLQ